MRLAKRRPGWLSAARRFEGTTRQVRVGGEWLDILRIGSGEPVVIVPGLAGGPAGGATREAV